LRFAYLFAIPYILICPVTSGLLKMIKNKSLSNTMIDHIIYGVPELESGIQQIEDLLGVRPVMGGQHPDYGTHNALLGLGEGKYLEIIAPDPGQPNAPRPLWMGLDDLTGPRLIRWAAKSDRLANRCQRALQSGVDLGAVFPGRRATPSGQILSWELTDPRKEIAGGIVPFFIDWQQSAHPADNLPQAGTLTRFWAAHPSPEQAQQMLKAVGLQLEVLPGESPQLYAEIRRSEKIVYIENGSDFIDKI